MIVNLIEAKVSYNKQDERKVIRTVWEKYLVSDISLSAVENRIIEYVRPFSTDGEIVVNALSQTKYCEIIGMDDSGETDLWFFVKIYYILVDERTGKQKREPAHFLVRASSPQGASIKMDDAMKDCMTDYKIDRVVEMEYSDVILND